MDELLRTLIILIPMALLVAFLIVPNRTPQPALVSGALLLALIVASVLVLLSLNRRDLWFFTHATLAFAPLALTHVLILTSPLPNTIKAVGLVLLLGVGFPLIGMYDTNYLELMIQISIFSALALGLNIVVGFAGLLDLGYIAFFAVGAYVWGVATSSAETVFRINGWIVDPVAFYLFIFVGVLLAAVAGILLGLPVLRLRGDYLAIVTLGFGEMIRILFNNLDAPINLTNGPQGLHGVAAPPSDFFIEPLKGLATVANIQIASPVPLAQQVLFYFLAIGIVGVIILLATRLDNSPIGRAWTAIREDEVAAIAMGVPLVRLKLMAFATGAACAGAVGVLYAAKQTFVSPESFQIIQSINVLAMVIVGGMGGIRGALLGAGIVTLLNLQVLTNFALQINALSNIDYVVPAPTLQIGFAIILGLVLVWLYRTAMRQLQTSARNTYFGILAVVGLFGGLFILLMADFHVNQWPSQLTPDKYQRFIFGILLVIMMILRPAGLLPEPRRKLELIREEAIPEAELKENANVPA